MRPYLSICEICRKACFFWEPMILAHGKMDGLLQLETECVARRSHTGDKNMKLISCGVITLVLILTSVPLIYGQDLSKYRTFSFGMRVASVSSKAEQQ